LGPVWFLGQHQPRLKALQFRGVDARLAAAAARKRHQGWDEEWESCAK
jgi:hypothetical protein